MAYILKFYLAFFLASIVTFYLAFFMASIYSDILSGILPGIHSDILSGILYLRVQAWATARVRVQAWSTAPGAGDMEFGSRCGPLHPELAIWRSCPQSWRARRGGRGGREGEEGGAAPLLGTLTWLAGGEILGKKHNMFQRHKLFKSTANT